MSTTAAAPQPRPKFSAGSDESILSQKLQTLLAASDGDGNQIVTGEAGKEKGRWTLIPSGEGMERSFKFKTFAKTWDFMTAVALQCKLKNHHPEWSNVYNTTFIRWTTHSPQGLSAQDVELASICDSLAKDFGEVSEETSGVSNNSNSCNMGQQLADTVASSAGDCCTPKPKGKA
ncbi:putative Pterin 4 alpha carbinolamine dehydratase-domain-containing protein [Seiridium unicorne]|uniref:4a-hydroxytetrahydrobiopterin dehydratase n=1 Tax=Seiridium unicorne TaxID=138068 RepID=A0ABR2UE41_9PEZI